MEKKEDNIMIKFDEDLELIKKLIRSFHRYREYIEIFEDDEENKFNIPIKETIFKLIDLINKRIDYISKNYIKKMYEKIDKINFKLI